MPPNALTSAFIAFRAHARLAGLVNQRESHLPTAGTSAVQFLEPGAAAANPADSNALHISHGRNNRTVTARGYLLFRAMKSLKSAIDGSTIRASNTKAAALSLTRRWRLRAIAGASLLAFTGTAVGHAALVDTMPANAANLAAPPAEIVLVFTEIVTPVVVRVLGDEGQEVARIEGVRGDEQRVVLPVPPNLPDGRYLVSYRVISADAHPVAGTFSFSVGAVGTVGKVGRIEIQERRLDSAHAVALANRLVQFISLFIVAGSLFFLVLVQPPTYVEKRLRKLVARATAVAAATYVLALGVGGADMAGMGLDGLFDFSVWKLGANTTLLDSAIAGVCGLIIVTLAWRISHAGTRAGMFVLGGVAALSGLVFTGHAATAAPQWLMAPAVALHLFTAAFWVAATMPLVWILNTSPAREATLILGRFSTVATIALSVLVATGVCVTIVQVQSLSFLLSTDYGEVLSLKLSLVVLLFALAAFNKFWLTPRINSSESREVEKLRRTIYIELVAMVGILILTTILTTTVPPRSMTVEGPHDANSVLSKRAETINDFKETISREGYIVRVSLSPARAGRTTLNVTVQSEGGAPFTPMQIDANLSLPERDIAPIAIELEPLGSGHYFADIQQIIISGTWDLGIDILIDDFTKVSYQMRVPIAAKQSF